MQTFRDLFQNVIRLKIIVSVFVNICVCTSNYVPYRRGGGHIVFGADPVGVGVGVSVTLSCLHDIS